MAIVQMELKYHCYKYFNFQKILFSCFICHKMFQVKLNIILLHFYVTEKFIQVRVSTHNFSAISVLEKKGAV